MKKTCFLDAFFAPTTVADIEVGEEEDAAAIHHFGCPAEGYIHAEDEDDVGDVADVEDKSDKLENKGFLCVSCTRYGQEIDVSRYLEQERGAHYPQGWDRSRNQFGYIGINAQNEFGEQREE